MPPTTGLDAEIAELDEVWHELDALEDWVHQGGLSEFTARRVAAEIAVLRAQVDDVRAKIGA